MGRKNAITEYNKPRAKWYFALFKFLELFGVFLFTFGFYGLGCLVYKHFPEFYSELSFGEWPTCTSYLCMWWAGFVSLILIICGLLLICLISCLIYQIITSWIKGNWNLAKRCAEDKNAKAKRLK